MEGSNLKKEDKTPKLNLESEMGVLIDLFKEETKIISSSLKSIEEGEKIGSLNKELIENIYNSGKIIYLKVESFINENKNKVENMDDKYEAQVILGIIHDVKNYLNPILGFAGELLDDDSFDKETQNHFLEMIRRANSDFERMIIKLVNKKEEGEVVDLNLDYLLESFEKRYELEAKKKNIEIRIEKGGATIKTDRDILESVLRNLIENALKFTKENGKIEVGVKKEEGIMKIFVKDSGVGISPERLDNFFEKPGETSLGIKGEKGTGIGLYTSKAILNKIGGLIEVESEEGKGSTFTVTLPLDATTEEDKK